MKNNFSFKKLKNIVFIVYSDLIEELLKISKLYGLKTLIITSSDQAKKYNKNIQYKILDKQDLNFKKYVLKNVKVEETLFVSLGSRIIFSKEIIENFFKYNLVNFHSSRLPLDSGGGNISWRILRNDRIENQLVHLVNETIDGGPIIKSSKSIFPKNCHLPIEHEKFCNKNFLIFFDKFVKELKNSKVFKLYPQVDYIGRYNPRLNTDINGWIDWSLKSSDLIKFIDAFDDPYTGAKTTINDKVVKIKKAQLHGGDSSNHPFMSGIISRHDKEWLVVSTVDENMLIIECVLDNKDNNILAKIKVGDRFVTPTDKIFLSKKIRPKYNSKGLKI